MTVISLFVVFIWINVIANTESNKYPFDCRDSSDCGFRDCAFGLDGPVVCCHVIKPLLAYSQCLCPKECKRKGGKPARPATCKEQHEKCKPGSFAPAKRCCEGLRCEAYGMGSRWGKCVPKATCQEQLEECSLFWPPVIPKTCCDGLKCKAIPGTLYGKCAPKGVKPEECGGFVGKPCPQGYHCVYDSAGGDFGVCKPSEASEGCIYPNECPAHLPACCVKGPYGPGPLPTSSKCFPNHCPRGWHDIHME